MLAGVERRISHGLVGVEERTPDDHAKKAVTIEQLAARFLGDVEGVLGYASPKIKSLDNYRRDARTALSARILPTLGKRVAASLTSGDVERWRDALLARKLAAASVVQSLAILSKLYTWSRKVGLLECHSPVHGVERPSPAQSLDYLDGAEVARLLLRVEALGAVGVASWQAFTLFPMVASVIG